MKMYYRGYVLCGERKEQNLDCEPTDHAVLLQ